MPSPWNQIEEDPDFQKMSGGEKQQVRQKWLDAISKDPYYSKLSNDQRQGIRRRIGLDPTPTPKTTLEKARDEISNVADKAISEAKSITSKAQHGLAQAGDITGLLDLRKETNEKLNKTIKDAFPQIETLSKKAEAIQQEPISQKIQRYSSTTNPGSLRPELNSMGYQAVGFLEPNITTEPLTKSTISYENRVEGPSKFQTAEEKKAASQLDTFQESTKRAVNQVSAWMDTFNPQPMGMNNPRPFETRERPDTPEEMTIRNLAQVMMAIQIGADSIGTFLEPHSKALAESVLKTDAGRQWYRDTIKTGSDNELYNAWRNAPSAEARKALYNNNPELRDIINNIHNVGEGMRETTQAAEEAGESISPSEAFERTVKNNPTPVAPAKQPLSTEEGLASSLKSSPEINAGEVNPLDKPVIEMKANLAATSLVADPAQAMEKNLSKEGVSKTIAEIKQLYFDKVNGRAAEGVSITPSDTAKTAILAKLQGPEQYQFASSAPHLYEVLNGTPIPDEVKTRFQQTLKPIARSLGVTKLNPTNFAKVYVSGNVNYIQVDALNKAIFEAQAKAKGMKPEIIERAYLESLSAAKNPVETRLVQNEEAIDQANAGKLSKHIQELKARAQAQEATETTQEAPIEPAKAPIETHFKFNPNSTEKEGKYRLRAPEDFVPNTTVESKQFGGVHAPNGVTFRLATDKKTGKQAIKTIRFDRKLWPQEKASQFWNFVKNNQAFNKQWSDESWTPERLEKEAKHPRQVEFSEPTKTPNPQDINTAVENGQPIGNVLEDDRHQALVDQAKGILSPLDARARLENGDISFNPEVLERESYPTSSSKGISEMELVELDASFPDVEKKKLHDIWEKYKSEKSEMMGVHPGELTEAQFKELHPNVDIAVHRQFVKTLEDQKAAAEGKQAKELEKAVPSTPALSFFRENKIDPKAIKQAGYSGEMANLKNRGIVAKGGYPSLDLAREALAEHFQKMGIAKPAESLNDLFDLLDLEARQGKMSQGIAGMVRDQPGTAQGVQPEAQRPIISSTSNLPAQGSALSPGISQNPEELAAQESVSGPSTWSITENGLLRNTSFAERQKSLFIDEARAYGVTPDHPELPQWISNRANFAKEKAYKALREWGKQMGEGKAPFDQEKMDRILNMIRRDNERIDLSTRKPQGNVDVMGKPIHAQYTGTMKDPITGEETPLFNITKPGHPSLGSTVSEKTLREMGLNVPPLEVAGVADKVSALAQTPEGKAYLKPIQQDIDFGGVNKLPEVLGKTGIIDYRGLEINKWEDAAEIVRAAQDRRLEHWNAFLLKDNKIVYHEILTSNLPNAVAITPDHIARLKAMALQLGADKFMDGHNHPSGETEPSPEDIAHAKKLRTELGEAGVEHIGSVVTNGDEFHSIDRDGYAARHEFQNPIEVLRRQTPLIESRDDVVAAASKDARLGKNTLVILTDARNKIMSMEVASKAINIPKFVKDRVIQHKATGAFIVTPINPYDLTEQLPNEVRDIIQVDRDGKIKKALYPIPPVPGREQSAYGPIQSMRVAEETPKYLGGQQMDSPTFKKNLAKSNIEPGSKVTARVDFETEKGMVKQRLLGEVLGIDTEGVQMLVDFGQGLPVIVRPENLVETYQAPDELKQPLQEGGAGDNTMASKGLFADDIPVTLGGMDQIRPFEMPELVKLSKNLMGAYPEIKKMGGMKRGEFTPSGEGMIKLQPSLFENTEQAAKTLAHELGHLADYIPDHTMARGNLLGRIQSLNKYMKETFGGDLETGRPGMNVTNKEIREELMALSKYWRPFDESEVSANFLKYRKKSSELYADAISVLFNNPGLLEEKAPKFYKQFFLSLDKKPEFKNEFFELQDLLSGSPEAILKARQEDIRQMWDRSEDIFKAKTQERALKESRILERLRQEYDDAYYPILKKMEALRKEGKPIPEEMHLKNLLQEVSMADNVNFLQGHEIETKVVNPLRKMGVSYDDISDYLFLNRVLNDRSKFANPLGHTPKTAQAQLDFMKKDLGEDKFKALADGAHKFHDIVFSSVETGVATGVINKEMFFEKILPNKNTYASFAVLDYLEETGNISATVKKQSGTFKEIANPMTATMMKTFALNRLNSLQMAKNSFIKNWQEHFKDEILPSKEMGGHQGPKIFKNRPGYGQLMVMEDGKMKAYDVDPFIAEAFDKHKVGTLNAAAYISSMINNGIFRPLYIDFNPGFIFWKSPVRYFQRTWKLNPNATLKTQLIEYFKALPSSAKMALGNPDDLVKEMIANKALDIGFGDYDPALSNTQYARLLKRLGIPVDEVAINENKLEMPKLFKGPIVSKLMKPISMAAHAIYKGVLEPLSTGSHFVAETLTDAHKIASYRIRKSYGESGDELSFNVKNFAGIPNWRVRGLNTKTSNAFFMFSNILKEHYKTAGEIAFSPKTRGGYWFKSAITDIFPKMLMVAAAGGYMGKKIKESMDRASEYDKTNYTVIPLGEVAGGKFGWKTAYIRIPGDDLGRLIGGITWKMGHHMTGTKRGGMQDILNLANGMTPSLAPSLTTAMQWGLFASGVPPYDLFHGWPIVPRDVMDAGGWPALRRMIQWQVNELGLAQFTTYDPSQKTRTEIAVQMSPIINSILKISDYGMEEVSREHIFHEESEAAHLNYLKGQRDLTPEEQQRLKLLNKVKYQFNKRNQAYKQAIRSGDTDMAEQQSQGMNQLEEMVKQK